MLICLFPDGDRCFLGMNWGGKRSQDTQWTPNWTLSHSLRSQPRLGATGATVTCVVGKGEALALLLSPANLLPGSESQLRACVLSAMTRLFLFVLCKTFLAWPPLCPSTPYLLLLVPCLQLSAGVISEPFHSSDAVLASWEVFPLLSAWRWLSSQKNLDAFTLTPQLSHPLWQHLSKIKKWCQIMACLSLPPYNYYSCPPLQPCSLPGSKHSGLSHSLKYTKLTPVLETLFL